MAPGTFFCINFPTIFGPIWDRGRAKGWGVGCWGGVKVGYLEISKTGSNTQMTVCRGWGVYVRTYVTYVCTYLFMI